MNLGRLILRLTVGGFFVGHGLQKLFGWFGGGGLEGTGQFFSSLGLAPGRRNAAVAGIAETAGGSLLALGLATPLASAALIGVLATAIRTVHLQNGPWSTEGGYEYQLSLIAALLALTEGGPGGVSLDRALGTEKKGRGWMTAAAVLGLAGSYLATELGDRGAEGPAAETAAAGDFAATEDAPAA